MDSSSQSESVGFDEALLPYEKQILLDIFGSDGLLIMAKGLGIDRILLNMMKIYCHSGYFVLVVNVGSDDQSRLIEKLRTTSFVKDVHTVDSSLTTTQRKSLYEKGGMFFATARILVGDMLNKTIPTEKLTGLLINNAGRILDSPQEKFIIRMFREQNKQGFIKAFSDNPSSFVGSRLLKTETSMKSLFVRNMFLWPRFHALVHETFEKCLPDVTEIMVKMTEKMKSTQTALLRLIRSCFDELKRSSKHPEIADISFEKVMLPTFYRQYRSILKDVWHELGENVRGLLHDIRQLRGLLASLFRLDPISFFKLVDTIRIEAKESRTSRIWMLSDPADDLLHFSRARVYGTGTGSWIPKECDVKSCITENVKLRQLKKLVFDEIGKDGHDAKRPIVVIGAYEDTCTEIKHFLSCEDDDQYIKAKLSSDISQEQFGSLAVKEILKCKPRSSLDSTFVHKPIEEYMLNNNVDMLSAASSGEILLDLDSPPIVILSWFDLDRSSLTLVDLLVKCTTKIVIIYDCLLPIVRQIEVYSALQASREKISVYILTFLETSEEQVYLYSITQEKQAMNDLIRKKTDMVIPDDEHLLRLCGGAATAVEEDDDNTQKQDILKQKIVVDVRELRSELPSMLHNKSIELIPMTLEVGDYILTPDICVERKSLNDLIGSMNEGRLYTQVSIMARHYSKPVLLIEFNREGEKFSLQNSRYSTSDNTFNSKDTYSKLTLLTITFPKLRIIWSSIPAETADIFYELKLGKDQPDHIAASSLLTDKFATNSRYDDAMKDLLLKIPGITFRNCKSIMDNVNSLKDLCVVSEEGLTEILENNIFAKRVWEFFHTSSG